MKVKVLELTGDEMPSEFKTVADVAETHLGSEGRLVSMSKSWYRDRYPDHQVVFNANVFGCPVDGSAEVSKLWYGDIDLTLEGAQVQALADELQQRVYVLFEMDGRFGLERAPRLDSPVAVYEPQAQP